MGRISICEIFVETVNGERYIVGHDIEKTTINLPFEENICKLTAIGPIQVGLELRGRYIKNYLGKPFSYSFEGGEVAKITIKFEWHKVVAM